MSNPARYHAFGKVRGTTDVFRLDAPGTRGYAGGIDPDQNLAVYQQIEGSGSVSSGSTSTIRPRRRG